LAGPRSFCERSACALSLWLRNAPLAAGRAAGCKRPGPSSKGTERKNCSPATSRTRLLSIRGYFIFPQKGWPCSDQEYSRVRKASFRAVSGSAFAAASELVLKSGQSVLQSQNGFIYEVFPDGRSRNREKKLNHPPLVVSGSTFTISVRRTYAHG